VDVIDFGILMSYWGNTKNLVLKNKKRIDLNNDKYVNEIDAGIMLSCWNSLASRECYE
jgi:hypothetical protein